jgi:ABC-type transporter Mla maintaining outer membrane lipid asymmetry ATPase subunit MlaF
VTPPALEIEGVTKDYRGLRPLRIQQLTVAAGEPVAILGFDAASAETFVNLLTGATLPDAGSIRVFGRSTSSIADGDDWLASLDTFGIVTPRAVLLEELTPIQNLAMPITLDVEPPAPDVREQAEALAREVGLPGDMWTGAVANLNGAARARVRLGRALAMNPALLLLEHASAGMAPGEAAAFGRDVRALAARRAIAVVAATADDGFARAVAVRVLALEAASGRLAEPRRGWFR